MRAGRNNDAERAARQIGLFNAQALEGMKRDGFTGELNVIWHNGGIHRLELKTAVSWGKRGKPVELIEGEEEEG